MSTAADQNRVGLLWLEYREKVIPREASRTQLLECRRAFYAGAHALLTELQIMLDPGGEPTEDDVRKVSLIEAELKRFNDDVQRGRA
jgi:hypothetical protein